MFQVKQNESTASRKRLPILLVDATDGFTGEVGVTSPTISISKNGATAASGTGSFVEIGQGQYYYEFASGEIDTLGWVSIYVIKTGTTRAYNAIVQIMAYDYAEGTNLGLSALPTAAIGATGALLTSYTSNGALGLSSTGAVTNVANVASGLSDADAAGLRYRLGLDGTATAPSATGNLGANIGSLGSVGSVTGNINGSLTGDVLGDVQGVVNAVNNLNGTAIAQIWDWASASIGNTSSIGYQLKFNVDEPISTIDTNVWNYDITGIGSTALAGGALEAAGTATGGTGCSSAIEIAAAVWDYDLSSYTSSTGVAGERLQLVPTYVWQQDIESLTQDIWQANTKLINTVNSVYDPNIPGQIIGANVWNYDVTTQSSPGSYAGGYLLDISTWSYGAYNKPDETTIANAVWVYDTTGVTPGTPYAAAVLAGAATGASVAEIANQVWSTDISGYTNPSAGYDLANVGAGSGGSSAAEIATAVWEANVVGVGGTTSAAVYLTNTLFTAGNIEVYVANQTPQDVWSYSGLEGRTITGGTGVTLATALPSNFSLLSINGSGQVTTSNPGTGSSTPAEIASAVWSAVTREITGGTITTNNDKTGYSLTQAFPTNFATLAINGSGQVTTSNPGTGSSSTTEIAQAVWNYNTGTGASAATQINLAAIGDSAATAKAVWDTELTGNTYPVSNKAGHELYATHAQTGNIPFQVWRYDSSGHIGVSDSFAELMWYAASGSSSTTKNNYANAIWNYNTGTGASAATQLNAAAIAGSGGSSANEVAQAVWSYNTGTGASAAAQLNTAASGIGYTASGVADAVWARILDNGQSPYSADMWVSNLIPQAIDNVIGLTTGISTQVWDQSLENISGDPIFGPNRAGNYLWALADNIGGISSTSAQSIAASVWNYNTGTGASASVQLNTAASAGAGSSATEIAQAVWTYNNGRSITSGTGVTLSPGQVPTNFTLLSINGSGQVTTSNPGTGSSTETAAAVWAYGITGSGPSGSAEEALSGAYTASGNTYTQLVNFTPNDIWTYAGIEGRTITGGIGVTLATALPNNFSSLSINGSGQVTTSNPGTGSSTPTEIASAVWSAGTRTITGGTITTVSDKTGYSLTQAFPTNFATLAINGSGQVTTSNPGTGSSSATEIASAVWSAGSRTVTGGSNITLASGQVPTNFTTMSIDGTGKVSVQAADISTIKSGLSTLTQAQVGTEVDSSLSDVGLTTTVTGRIDAAISSRLASASAPVNFSILAINGSGEVTTSNPGTGASATQIASAVWTANRASIGASDGQFGYYLNAPVSAAGGTVTQVMLGPFALAATDGNNGYLNVYVDDVRPVELVITDENGNAIPLDNNNTHSVLVYDSGSTLVATYTGTVEYEAGGIVSFPLDADVTGTAGSYKVVFDIDNGLTISKYGGLTILVKLC